MRNTVTLFKASLGIERSRDVIVRASQEGFPEIAFRVQRMVKKKCQACTSALLSAEGQRRGGARSHRTQH